MKHIEIETTEQFDELLAKPEKRICRHAFQGIDFVLKETLILEKQFEDNLFLGCNFSTKISAHIASKNAIFPILNVPFQTYPNRLYNCNTIYSGYQVGNPDSYENTYDKMVYNHFIEKGKESDDIKETLARWLHDHSISDAKHDFLSHYNERMVTGIMGGHSMLRTHPDYKTLALISKKLTEKGYLMVSGGGPGAMEATHLGAWFAGKNEDELQKALEILAKAPSYTHQLWLDTAMQVIHLFPEPLFKSLGVPTWLYGHEPPTPFATHIAKYFANSVREEGILAIAKGGIIFAPGSAGTIQEIFQDATQNHYLSFGFASPMVFFNTEYWTQAMPVFSLLKQLSIEGKYRNMILSISNNPDEIIAEIEKFPKQ